MLYLWCILYFNWDFCVKGKYNRETEFHASGMQLITASSGQEEFLFSLQKCILQSSYIMARGSNVGYLNLFNMPVLST